MKKIFSRSLLSLVLGAASVLNATAQQTEPTYPEKDNVAYLFTYFTGQSEAEHGEALRFAVSLDGYNFKALNNNKPVLDPKTLSSTGGVRDPHILRGHDGKTFYMVMTDMTASKGWDSNRAMVLCRSTDLVNWKTTVVNIQKTFPGNENLKRVWAPQTIYDAAAGKYMIYFSMQHNKDNDIIYYAYANADFTGLESAPKVLFIPKSKGACIDADIVEKDGVYHMIYKTEDNTAGLKTATTKNLTSGQWTEYDKYLQQTTQSVEGGGVFKLNNSDEYILMYDVYKNGRYEFTKSKDLQNFKVINDEVTMDFKPRHGTVMPITRSELKRLLAKWGTPSGLAQVNNNPVLEGFYADPDVLYSEKTGKYYIYPTSDGFDGWGGYYFKVFSSDNLVDWKDEGVMLDLKKDVTWANRNAWAPCIVEKKINGQFQYFYYYTAAQKIGVAVADNPTGPFKDSGKALIDTKPDGVKGGQVIDPDVFTDPKTNKTYLYWGNGFMAGAELNDDMVSINQKTLTLLKPDNTYREGTYVIYRNGTYYFMWSEDDTRSPNYKVRYATSKSPLGKFTIPKDNIVIKQDPEKQLFGTGHNSVVKVPGKDEWYIVYHRFSYPNGYKMGEAAGYHREVCIDKLEFDKKGNIITVKPTVEGIKPVK